MDTQTKNNPDLKDKISTWLDELTQLLTINMIQRSQILEATAPVLERVDVFGMLFETIRVGLLELDAHIQGEWKEDRLPQISAWCPYCYTALGDFPLVGDDGEPVDLDGIDKLLVEWWDAQDFECPNCAFDFAPISDERSGDNERP